MIVDYLHVFGTGIGPPEHAPPLIIDADRVLTRQLKSDGSGSVVCYARPLAPQNLMKIIRTARISRRGCRMEVVDDEDDPVLPSAIEHKCEEILDGDQLNQKYNYLVYHFEVGGCYFWARAYLRNIESVALYGPFESRATMRLVEGSLDEAVIAYLKRRFWTIQTYGRDGYATLWSASIPAD
jgi:hypothetical protein